MKATGSMFRLTAIVLGGVLCILGGMLLPSSASAQLHGTYTIGSGGTYASFGAAVSALVSQGVSAPVTFNVFTGTYGEHVSIPAITGANSTNTITFQSATGNAADVTLFFNAAAPESN